MQELCQVVLMQKSSLPGKQQPPEWCEVQRHWDLYLQAGRAFKLPPSPQRSAILFSSRIETESRAFAVLALKHGSVCPQDTTPPVSSSTQNAPDMLYLLLCRYTAGRSMPCSQHQR